MSYFARATRRLAMLDGPVNHLNDLAVRVTPWMWWPASPPRPDRPRLPEEYRSTGRRLRNERVATGLASVALWFVAAGAWDRRAERHRRRPWRRR